MTWQDQRLPSDHPPVNSGKVGVLVINLGTPEAPTTQSVKTYLAEFLSDRRVVEIPPIAWQPILRGIILNTRPKKSAAAYKKVWTEEGSPLEYITRGQAERLQERLGDAVNVSWAMRYGKPSIPDEIQKLMDSGCDRILLAPLYPQYSGATTATVIDKAAEKLKEMRWQASLRTLPPYHDDPAYIDALSKDLTAQLDALDFDPEVLLLSFHGMPQRTLDLGDPYHCHCRKTARLLEERMTPRKSMRFETSFQSRFGNAKWLEPATDDTLERLAGEGVKNIAIAAPGFSADCLETLEELALEGKEQFEEAGGENFAALSCLNTGTPGMDMLEHIIRRELSGWT
ncbi:ferrochelatase [Pontixanthobacter aestiaquae]|uniref:Ferrochelatase n=1 Tax=Pontixanthobacter aestiaquae TaxID=1509367 RepID=A0A844Z999_9SPHN|nr:ferrochelatase [Pontixanthobacter aestiaquae]MDN3644605.1 ferrochelatase [Pontixanthobacter aestiaquae]MXO84388.1 ferrochelatase [Pontixanthobacter aestiaquae]